MELDPTSADDAVCDGFWLSIQADSKVAKVTKDTFILLIVIQSLFLTYIAYVLY
jgi:hypothetical protein